MAAGVALLLYAVACSPLGMGFAVLIGSVDATHQFSLTVGDHGGQLVLHHGGDSPDHRHGAAANVLTLFARQPKVSGSDHVLQFNSPDSLKTQREPSAPLLHPAFRRLPPGMAANDSDPSSVRAAPVASPAWLEASGAPFGVRWTVLLI